LLIDTCLRQRCEGLPRFVRAVEQFLRAIECLLRLVQFTVAQQTARAIQRYAPAQQIRRRIVERARRREVAAGNLGEAVARAFQRVQAQAADQHRQQHQHRAHCSQRCADRPPVEHVSLPTRRLLRR
jgi:hypothetical protein